MPKEWREWQCPPKSAQENYLLGWLNEQCEDGQSWNKSQRGWSDYRAAFEILAGRNDISKIPDYRSKISTGRLKRNIRQVRGGVTNIRPIWGFSSQNEAFQENAQMLNIVSQHIYQDQFLDMAIRDAFDWAASTCTGWIHPVYRRDFAGTGEGNLNLDTFGQPCILPTQMPSNGDIQKAYAVSLLDEMPIYMAHGIWPDFQDKLHPTSSKTWYASEIRTAAKGNLMQRMFGSWLRPAGGESALSDAYVPIRKTWIIDLAINKTGQTMYMGDWTYVKGTPVPQSPWSYEVPYVDQVMPDGHKATKAEARIYPNRRLIISSETVVLYDGPAFDWHRELPLIPLCLDSWAFDRTGFSLVREGYDLQQALNEMERGILDKNKAQLDMAMAYDINSVNPKEANQFDPMEPRGRVGFDGSLVTQPFVPVMPDAVIKVAPEQFTEIEHLEQTMDYQLGVNDIAGMARARSVVATEGAVDKMLEASGPIVSDITRSVEWTLTKVGGQVRYIIPQFYTTRRIISYTGPNRVSQINFDFDPAKLIPSHMPGERAFDDKGKPVKSAYDMLQRARWFADNIRYSISPHTAHEMVQMAYKLGLIQLRKAGIQISSRTIAEAWNIQNFGGPDAATEYERYMAEQMDVAQHAIQVKMAVDQIMQAGVQPTPAMTEALARLLGGQPQEGRPSSGQQAPQLNSKDGGVRSTISESGS